MARISFGVSNVCEALKTQKNPRHAPCPQQSNRTAVGLSRPSTSLLFAGPKDVDGRVKPGHDELKNLVSRQPTAEAVRQVFCSAFFGMKVALRLSNSSTFTPFLRMM